MKGRWDFDRSLVGHDLAQNLVVFNQIAWLHTPFYEFTFVDAFTEFRKFKFHLFSPLVLLVFCDR